MNRPTKRCRICGREYEACRPTYTTNNIFRWQDVACCEEHGTEYFELVMASREENKVHENNKADVSTNLIYDATSDKKNGTHKQQTQKRERKSKSQDE